MPQGFRGFPDIMARKACGAAQAVAEGVCGRDTVRQEGNIDQDRNQGLPLVTYSPSESLPSKGSMASPQKAPLVQDHTFTI